MSRCECGDPQCRPPVPRPGESEDDTKLAVIAHHLPTLFGMRHEARLQCREVESWTLPAVWDPGANADAPGPRPADEPPRPAKVLGVDVKFEGSRIVAHWSEGEPHLTRG